MEKSMPFLLPKSAGIRKQNAISVFLKLIPFITKKDADAPFLFIKIFETGRKPSSVKG